MARVIHWIVPIAGRLISGTSEFPDETVDREVRRLLTLDVTDQVIADMGDIRWCEGECNP